VQNTKDSSYKVLQFDAIGSQKKQT